MVLLDTFGASCHARTREMQPHKNEYATNFYPTMMPLIYLI